MGGWPESDNMTISVQLNLTGTGTGTELGKKHYFRDIDITVVGALGKIQILL